MSTNYVTSNSISNDSYSSMGPLMCLPASYPMQDEPCTDQWLPPQWLHRFQIVPKMSLHQTVTTLPEVDGTGRESIGDGADYRDFSPDNDIKSEFTADSHSNPCLWTSSSFSSHLSLTKRLSDVLTEPEPVPVTHSTPASLGFEQPKSEPNVNGQTTFSSTTSTAFSEWKANPTCAGCDQLMKVDKPCLRLSDGRLWHVDCLVCAQCTKPLHLDPSCFSREGNIYCKEDYQRLFKMNKLFPVCAACQQPIHSLDLIMRVSGTIYHYTCFTCTQCTRMLRPGDQFFVRHGQLVCGQFVCQVRANKEPDHDRTISRTPSPGPEEEITPCEYDRDPLPTQFPFPFILPRSELVQEDQPAEKMTLTEQRTVINHKKYSLSEFNPDEAGCKAGRPVITPTCEQLSDLSEYNPLVELTIPPGDNAYLGSPHQFGFEFNPNPVPHHFFDPESDSVPASLPFPATISPRSRIYPSQNENGLNSVVIPYPHSNRSPTHSSVTSSSLGSLSTRSLIHPIQSCLCPIPSMGPSSICDDLTKMATYSSFLPTSGVTLVPSSPRIGPNPLLNAPTGLLKLISPGASMLYGQTPVTSPNSGPLSLGNSSQKRNRKRRAGLHQNFDAVCLTGPNGYCLGLSQRQKRMRTSFKHHQLRAMKAYFNMNHNPDVKDLKVLTEKTGLSKRVLQVWFQNARAKYRRSLHRQEGPNPNQNTNSINTISATTGDDNNNANDTTKIPFSKAINSCTNIATAAVTATTGRTTNTSGNNLGNKPHEMATSSTSSTSDSALLSSNSFSDCDSKSSHFDVVETGSQLSPKSLYRNSHSHISEDLVAPALDILSEIHRKPLHSIGIKTSDPGGIYSLRLASSSPPHLGSAVPNPFDETDSRIPHTTFSFISSNCRPRDLCTLGGIHG